MKLINGLAAVALMIPAASQSQVIGKRSDSTCLDLRANKITVTGTLKLQHLQGEAPNQDAFMVELPDPDCVDHDSTALVGDADMLMDVRANTDDSGILKRLAALVGRRVTVTGTARLGQIEPDGAPLVVVAAQAEPTAD